MMNKYQFSGDPMSQALAAKSHQATMQMQGQVGAAAQQAAGQRYAAQGNLLSTLYSQPAQFASSVADAYQPYAQGIGSIAAAMAQQASNAMGARASAEAARQMAASNIGSSALAAYGGVNNNALQAWAANQTANQKAMADMHAANQQALTGRASALASLGPASRASEVRFGSGGGTGSGGFSASGVGGPIASGGFGGGAGGMGGGYARTGPDQSFLNSLRADIMSGDEMRLADSAGQRLDAAYYSSRDMPRDMAREALAGLTGLAERGYAESGRGMDQFYASQAGAGGAANFGGLLSQLGSGYGNALSGIQNYANMIRDPMTTWERLINPEKGALAQERAQLERQMRNDAAMQSTMRPPEPRSFDEYRQGYRQMGVGTPASVLKKQWEATEAGRMDDYSRRLQNSIDRQTQARTKLGMM
jgi:hypothetical protein